jgi:hypothetical protein
VPDGLENYDELVAVISRIKPIEKQTVALPLGYVKMLNPMQARFFGRLPVRVIALTLIFLPFLFLFFGLHKKSNLGIALLKKQRFAIRLWIALNIMLVIISCTASFF